MGNATFEREFNDMQKAVHKLAVEKGWWGDGSDFAKASANDGEKIALIHSELSECLEGIREGNPPSEKIGDYGNPPEGEHAFCQAEEELADVIIRIMDYAEASGWNVGGAIRAKFLHNRTREHKHGGKAF